ncbi:MAG: hypothetical protein JSR71_08800, partial [Proteobacteria bacterium]|nr:hypothetical protein [Pseudomonadota bacterium]
LKENVIVGHLIPAGTGQREFENLLVTSEEEYQQLAGAPERRIRERELQD